MKKLFLLNVCILSLLCGCTNAKESESTPTELQTEQTKAAIVTVKNPTDISRKSETISLCAKSVLDSVPGLNRENAAIFDLQSDKLLTIQWLDKELLFQTDLKPGQEKKFRIMVRSDEMEVPKSKITTYCRFVPERQDDFAWENDKVCNRMYGPELEHETITCGIDAWGKCVPYPVFDKMIKAYVEKKIPYHENHGEGGDFYKVGNTLGCGGMAPLFNDNICLAPHNYYDWKVIANGPIRSVFELYYRPWKAGDYTVRETKRISIDLGSNMTRVECHYSSEDTKKLPLACGIILRDNSKQIWSQENGIAYWIPTDTVKGNMGCGVVFSDAYTVKQLKADSHLLLTMEWDISKPVDYYAGSCWDENEEFNSYEKWQNYLKNFKTRLDAPVSVKIQK